MLALPLLRQHVPPPARFLEIGCGAGDFGITLGQSGYTGLLTDFSPDAAREVTSRLGSEHSAIQFQQVDAFAIRTDQSYDLVILFEVLEHVADDGRLLEHIQHLVRPGGWLLMSVPARKKYWTKTDEDVGHYRRYERREVPALLANHGFKAVTLWSYGWPFLHLVRWLRDLAYRRHQSRLSAQSVSRRSQQSGLHDFNISGVRFFSHPFWWRPMVYLSRPFNRFDWSDGYLCLAQREQ